ncbi:Uncharacterized protein KF715C_pA4550 (plasmid) [Pseudomonas putida]|uniref:Uncharacterized protein n=1 Tax=Pseudomonas putida TaxID=303 RepID=A0A1L7NNA1_PSEPU|nr:Uncharacterized protein KF715C_pA4550 [Pseudomonas putida]
MYLGTVHRKPDSLQVWNRGSRLAIKAKAPQADGHTGLLCKSGTANTTECSRRGEREIGGLSYGGSLENVQCEL